jgi:hypothetical protein
MALAIIIFSTSRVSGQPFGEGIRSLIGKEEAIEIIDSLRQYNTTIACDSSCFKFIRLGSYSISYSLAGDDISILLMSEEHGSMIIRKYLNHVVMQDRLLYYDGYFVDSRLERLQVLGEYTEMVFERMNERDKEKWVENKNQLDEIRSTIILERYLRMIP